MVLAARMMIIVMLIMIAFVMRCVRSAYLALLRVHQCPLLPCLWFVWFVCIGRLFSRHHQFGCGTWSGFTEQQLQRCLVTEKCIIVLVVALVWSYPCCSWAHVFLSMLCVMHRRCPHFGGVVNEANARRRTTGGQRTEATELKTTNGRQL